MRAFLLALCIVSLAGCGGRTPMKVWGDVSYQGKSVAKGQIVFAPTGDTPGPTTGGDIADGKYEVPATIGPWSGGKYKVEITALAKNGKFLPNPADPKGPPVELADNFIPLRYNFQTELEVTVAPDASKNQFDFHLGK